MPDPYTPERYWNMPEPAMTLERGIIPKERCINFERCGSRRESYCTRCDACAVADGQNMGPEAIDVIRNLCAFKTMTADEMAKAIQKQREWLSWYDAGMTEGGK